MSTAPQRSATAVILPSRPNPRAQGLRPENGLGFFLFLLVNIALFVRPADVFPALEGINFYLGLILSCFAVSFLGVLKSFSPQRLERCPIDVFLIALLPIVFLSLASHSRIPEAVDETFSYFKILVYYFLLVTLVSTPSRLRLFLSVLILSTSVMTIMAMLDFFKIISLPRSFLIAGSRFSRIDPNRLYGPGIFHDPNDIAVIIGAATMLLMGKMLDDRGGLFRWLWLFPLGVFGLGFFFTQSRGGLLAFMAGFMTQVILRWGWSRAVFIGAMALPALLVMMAGRMTAISAETETGQSRIQLWEEGILMLKSNPLFGVGQNRYHEEAVQVAHNSYMQQFGDTGLPGGVLFLSSVMVALWGLWRLTTPLVEQRQVIPRIVADPDYARIHPALAGAVTTYCAGMMTLSMNFLVTTYAFLGLASVFLERATTIPPGRPLKLDFTLLIRLGMACLAFLVGMFIFVRLTYRS